jgi:hypothetical protein
MADHMGVHRMNRPRIETDDRPRCPAVGTYGDGEVPCDLHKDHDGKHLWQKPMSFEEFQWTDSRRVVRPYR